jgi:hypothetical protein
MNNFSGGIMFCTSGWCDAVKNGISYVDRLPDAIFRHIYRRNFELFGIQHFRWKTSGSKLKVVHTVVRKSSPAVFMNSCSE